ncbi:hypothetical protein [Actinospica robiniae]|uniref:hypothetical protein n=1 Tax=Actinospica robiniae TaxID=304901 RepID=UPI00041F98AE|nr:hypothetical protein [Actinospica robiniae]
MLRLIRFVFIVGFLEGTAAHAYDLADGGVHAFRGFPLVSQILFHALLILDPLAAWLVWKRIPSAPLLGAAIMIADDAANWQGNWPSVHADPSILLRPYGLPVLTLFGVFVVLTALPLRRSFAAQPA